jgi:hypothetical protein
MKAKWSAEIDLLIGNNISHAKSLLEQIREDLMEQIRPHKFNEDNNNSIIFKRAESFERLCYQLRKNNISNDPSTLSTYTFYMSVQLLTEEIERTNKR